MSDLDSLIVTFQTQLSDVMESVVKTAMYEVTRLVEDGFLKEVETLRMQLHWTEKKLSDREGEKRGRCVDCAKKDVELSTDATGDRCDHQQQDDGLRVCAVKKEGSPVERWTQGHRLGVVSELPQEADNASAVPSPERESQAAEEEEVVPAVDVKEEEGTKPSCSSVHLAEWSDTLDGKAGLESQSISERTEAQPKPTPKNSEELKEIPSTSKAAPPPPLSAQRVHLVDKQAAPLSRTGAQWVSVRSQSAIAHHTSPVPHTDSHTGPRNILRCGQCGKCFPHPSNLKAHLQTHTGERPFCCSLCGRSFTKLSNLKAHRRVHTGERPYCCMACGKRFTQKCNLKRHQRIHLDV
ncbi:unnamed protein product [Pleuronectes platessa]|uniref:C2H2-type domain-containing protein n=1 Tax=Pleuronectes platessa TaxID=8262 RepID=A0A9N7UNH6_PLEPL|nr:unnamed protein product [Pleuronectes platessa]